MRAFVSGGCKNGKSCFAQRLAKDCAERAALPLYYIATMQSTGKEDDERIRRHVQDREGWGFITIEQPTAILKVFEKADPSGVFLLDSLTALLANEMFLRQEVDENAALRLQKDLTLFCAAARHYVIVSDFLYSGAERYDDLTEGYRRGLALLDKTCARLAETVYEAASGQTLCLKGERP